METNKVTLIATCKDGGTRLVEYKGIKYHVDYRIGSETRGCVYDDYPSRGNRVEPELEQEIQVQLLTQVLR